MNNGSDSELASDQKPLIPADERWKMVRSAIEHEDNLVNRRLGWLFIGHTILFVCFAMLQKDVLSSEHKLESALAIEMGLAVVFLCATFIAMVTHRCNASANNHISSLREWWQNNGHVSTNFPPITGHVPEKRGSIPTLIALMDITLLVVCLGISSQRFLDSQLTASIPRAVESRSANEGNSAMGSSDQQSDVSASQEGGNSEGSEEAGGGDRNSGALNVP